MEQSFWHNCWENNKIAFHQLQPHQLLVKYFAENQFKPSLRVFVPLCGKSLDMLWFMSQGAYVVGCELSEIAVKQFFDENKLQYKVERINGFVVYSNELCTIYCGDIFSLTIDMVSKIDLVYDRAALIALPPVMREQYVIKIREFTNVATQILLIVINYDASEFTGPPFAIDDAIVKELYVTHCQINKIVQITEQTMPNSRMYAACINECSESLYQITCT